MPYSKKIRHNEQLLFSSFRVLPLRDQARLLSSFPITQCTRDVSALLVRLFFSSFILFYSFKVHLGPSCIILRAELAAIRLRDEKIQVLCDVMSCALTQHEKNNYYSLFGTNLRI